MVWSSNTVYDISAEQDQLASTSNAVRLVVDKDTKPTIELDELSIEKLENEGNGGNRPSQEAVFGAEFPVIRVNDLIVSMKNIKKFSIESSGVLPTISLTIAYNDSRIVNNNPVKDGDMISTYMRAGHSKSIAYLRNDFIITSCNSRVNPRGGESIISMDGVLFVPKFLSMNNTCGFIGTSKDVLKNIASDSGLGFAFNDYDNTDDYQNWICCRDSYENFIGDISKHSWKDDNSFFSSWVDLYYNLCYVNVNKFLLSTENEEEVDLTFATNTYSIVSTDASTLDDNKITVKLLSNLGNFRGSPFFITRWTPYNNSASVSLNEGYNRFSYTYRHNQDVYNENQDSCFETLKNVPSYDKSKTDSYILLRGRAGYDKDKNPENEMIRANHDFVNTYNICEWTGVEYMLSDKDKDSDSTNNNWHGNVHKNYNRSVCHNEINLAELDKMYIEVTCEGLCLQIMRGERVPVYIKTSGPKDEFFNTQEGTPDGASRFYSGYYIVDSIRYDYNFKGGSFSNYSTTFTLKRREWPTPEKI